MLTRSLRYMAVISLLKTVPAEKKNEGIKGDVIFISSVESVNKRSKY